MNENQPPPFAGPVASPAARIEATPPVLLGHLLTGLALSVALFDVCFWDVHGMGFSVAVFVIGLAGIIMVNREAAGKAYATKLILLLLAGAALSAAIETGVTNTLVLMALIVALAGVSYFREVESLWGRVLSQIVTLILAPGRAFWLGGVLLESACKKGFGGMASLVGGCLLMLPALVLALFFGTLLATGNAVFASWTNSFFDWFWKELDLYLNFGRIVLWCGVALVVLPLLRPANIQAWWWNWTLRLPRLPELIPARAALFSSGMVLLVLNFLFLVANVADVLFLWSGKALPTGVTLSGFVHNGTNALTWTVVLSALVLTGIFQQALPVAQRRELKGLALFWIAQNLFLLLSVAMRLKLYIEAFDMTVLRLSVIIFLVVVALGYTLLTIKIVQDRSLSWLIGGCILAVMATFYVTQFLDLAGWSANYNVARWEKDRSRKLDANYLATLGPDAWPGLQKAYGLAPGDHDIWEAWDTARKGQDYAEKTGLEWRHWREFSLRAYWNRGTLEEAGK